MMADQPRLMSGADAAAYCGLAAAAFAKWVAQGRIPKPLPGTRRWDRKAIDLAPDKASGIVTPAVIDGESELEMWKRARALRQEAEWERKYEASQSATVKR